MLELLQTIFFTLLRFDPDDDGEGPDLPPGSPPTRTDATQYLSMRLSCSLSLSFYRKVRRTMVHNTIDFVPQYWLHRVPHILILPYEVANSVCATDSTEGYVLCTSSCHTFPDVFLQHSHHMKPMYIQPFSDGSYQQYGHRSWRFCR